MTDYLQDYGLQKLPEFGGPSVTVEILRLDQIHPIVSGNKWFKLRYYLAEALQQGKTRIATFGGAYSNHIVAAAFAAQKSGLKSLGIIRGEAPDKPGKSLSDALSYGMELAFTSRDEFGQKQCLIERFTDADTYWIMEGGYGKPGARGASEILDFAGSGRFSHIICATGTGTMMAGLIKGAKQGQKVMGISVLKNHFSLESEVRALLEEPENHQDFAFIHGYHFGGYAKHPPELIRFMREVWHKWQVPTDIVYTSKLLFAVKKLTEASYFPPGSKLLLIHSGGLQGNRSLPSGTFDF